MTEEAMAAPLARRGHVLGVDDRRAPASAGLLNILNAWLPERRWYPVKGVVVETVPWVSYSLPAPPGLMVQIHLLRLVGEGVDLIVQVPVVLERVDESSDDGTPDDPSIIGTFRSSDDSLLRAYDGAAHPAFWLTALDACGWDVDPGELSARVLESGRSLGVEQSNSSIRLPDVADGVMLKVMRAVAVGPNPDVTLPRALAHHGWKGVPQPVAWLTATWTVDDAPVPSEDRFAHLVIVAELIGSARDGFDLACSYAKQNESFADLSGDLGRRVAQMHGALRASMPPGSRLDVDWLMSDLQTRAQEAAARAHVLERTADAVTAFYEGARTQLEALTDTPVLQHIHGDLHLGQALNSRDSGWKILDFEGEPLRPVADRTRTDLIMRDVAGMIRSFDYAAAVGGALDPRWVINTRNAFIDAYRRESHFPADQEAATETLIRVLTLDKALYEVVYESTNRPSWTWIPLEAVDRLLNNQL